MATAPAIDPILTALRAQQPGYQEGWGAPEHSGWQDEQRSWKESCYLGDWSFLMDLEVRGPDALKLFSDHTVNSYASFPTGRAKHAIYCSEAGKVIVEGVLMRMDDNCFRIQSGPAVFTDFLASRGGYDVTTSEISTFQLQVSGPSALAVCQKVTGEDLTDIGFMRFREVTIAGKRCYALRQGMAGEIGFEFHGDLSDRDSVSDAIMAAGAPHGIRRLGRRTAMINHLEAAFPTGLWHYVPDMFGKEVEGFAEWSGAKWAHAFTTPPALRGSFEGRSVRDYLLSPYEMGWGHCVRFDHEFTGRAALVHEAASGEGKRRVTLSYDPADLVDIYASLFEEGEEPFDHMDMPHPQRWVMWADAVMEDGKTVGIASSPGYSLWFRKMLALAFVDAGQAEPGTRVEVLWGQPGSRQRMIGATVCPAPFKTDRRRDSLTTTIPFQA